MLRIFIAITSFSVLTSLSLLASESLLIKSVLLEFENKTGLIVVTREQTLRAQLTVSYQGNGLLEGRWMVAEPGSTEAQPLFRTLLLVRENLSSSQRSIIDSPELPTAMTGKYLLQFCVTTRNSVSRTEVHVDKNPLCPQQKLISSIAYQVIAN